MMRTSLQNWVGAGILLAFMAAHAFGWYWFSHVFPRGYNWSEMLLNYQGGFAKRGLIGEIAFRLRFLVSPTLLISTLLFIAYISTSAVLIVFFRLHTILPGLLFLVSPAGWLFPLLIPAAYGRKDVFVVLAVAISLAIIGRKNGKNATLIAIMLVFLVAGVIVETSWFYFPAVFAAFLVTRKDEPLRWQLGAGAVAAAYTLGCEALTVLSGPVDAAAIAASWNHVPFTTDTAGALCCLNDTFKAALGAGREPLQSLASYLVAGVYGSIPLVLLIVKRPIRDVGALRWAAIAAGVVASALPMLVAADWGRFTYLSLTSLFLTYWTIVRFELPITAPRTWQAYSLAKNVVFAAVYASTWQVTHYQLPGKSAFIPGIVFRALNATSATKPPESHGPAASGVTDPHE